MERSDVLIVGAGPVGLTMACELARHGASCRIIDAAASPSLTSKALAIFPRTLEVFAAMGVVEPALAAGQKLRGLTLYAEHHRLAHLPFSTLDSPYAFVLSLPQSDTERLLTHHLARFGITVERRTEFITLNQEDDCVTVQLLHADGREETVSTSWLIGCDGAHSAVRRALGLSFTGAPYEETFVLGSGKETSEEPRSKLRGIDASKLLERSKLRGIAPVASKNAKMAQKLLPKSKCG